jgi:predicted CXXCH cytochrome family protein
MNRPGILKLAVKSLVVLAFTAAIVISASLVSASKAQSPASPPATTSITSAECMVCHGNKDLSIVLPSGDKLSLYSDPALMQSSVHKVLNCTDCHSDIVSFPHPARQFDSLRSFRVAEYEACKSCHFVEYTKTVDSVHFSALSQGIRNAPLCTDCHGSHGITPPDQPRLRISQTCSACHQTEYNTYADSVHGSALISNGNPDVPVCTDCHQVHNIQNPTTAEFRVQSVQLCVKCHSDPKVMDKYGISTQVQATYLESFHGMAIFLAGQNTKNQDIKEPVCTDCHGTHDIQLVTASTSPVIKANLLATCQECHAGAGTNFPTSWIGHYEPSLHRDPAVFAIRWFYRLLIPFILGGLLVHLLLDLWKTVTNR